MRVSFWTFLVLLSISPSLSFLVESRVEFTGRPVFNKLNTAEQIAMSYANETPLFALISDTHITDKAQTIEKWTGGNKKLCQTLRLVRGIGSPVLIVAGDLTDQGEKAEWSRFEALLHELENNNDGNRSKIRTLLVPGNHDFQGSPFVQARQLESSAEHDRYAFVVSYLSREARYLKLIQNVQGDLLTPGGEGLKNSTILKSIEEVLQDALNKRFALVPRRSNFSQIEQETMGITIYPPGFNTKLTNSRAQFDHLFPILFEDVKSATAFFLLNSSAHVFPGSSMGLGYLSQRQIDRLSTMLRSLAASVSTVVIVLHHPPVRRETDKWSIKDFYLHKTNSDIYHHTFLALNRDDAASLISTLSEFLQLRPNIQVVVAYGHRHGPPNLGKTTSGLWILETPSVIEEPNPGVWVTYRGKNEHLSFRWVSSSVNRSSPPESEPCREAKIVGSSANEVRPY